LPAGQFGPALPSVDSAVESWDSSVIEQSPPSNNTSPDSNQPPQQQLTVAEVYKSGECCIIKKGENVTHLVPQITVVSLSLFLRSHTLRISFIFGAKHLPVQTLNLFPEKGSVYFVYKCLFCSLYVYDS
jgi:hypothetical protein